MQCKMYKKNYKKIYKKKKLLKKNYNTTALKLKYKIYKLKKRICVWLKMVENNIKFFCRTKKNTKLGLKKLFFAKNCILHKKKTTNDWSNT